MMGSANTRPTEDQVLDEDPSVFSFRLKGARSRKCVHELEKKKWKSTELQLRVAVIAGEEK